MTNANSHNNFVAETDRYGTDDTIPMFVANTPPPAMVTDSDRHRVPYATGPHGTVAQWDITPGVSSPHMLISAEGRGGKTSALRTVIIAATARGLPVLASDAPEIGLAGMTNFPGVAAVADTVGDSIALIDAVHTEMVARLHHVRARAINALPVFIIAIDEFSVLGNLLRRAAAYEGRDSDMRALATLIKDSAPLDKITEMFTLIRHVGGRFIVTVPRPSAFTVGDAAGGIRDAIGTRAALSPLNRLESATMWETPRYIGGDNRYIPGRGEVAGPVDSPMTAQMHWTPNVGDHPDELAQLTVPDRHSVTEFREAAHRTFVAPQWYSAHMQAFVDSRAQTSPTQSV